MTRPSLPQTQTAPGGSAFFPSFQKEMNRLLDQFKSGFPMLDDDGATAFSAASFPAIDMVETDDAVEITAEVPGVGQDDLDVTMNGSTLVLKGEKKAEHEKTEENYHVVERRYGSFRRQIDLGFSPDDGAVKAGFTDGILKVVVTKPETAKAGVQKIAIQKT